METPAFLQLLFEPVADGRLDENDDGGADENQQGEDAGQVPAAQTGAKGEPHFCPFCRAIQASISRIES